MSLCKRTHRADPVVVAKGLKSPSIKHHATATSTALGRTVYHPTGYLSPRIANHQVASLQIDVAPSESQQLRSA